MQIIKCDVKSCGRVCTGESHEGILLGKKYDFCNECFQKLEDLISVKLDGGRSEEPGYTITTTPAIWPWINPTLPSDGTSWPLPATYPRITWTCQCDENGVTYLYPITSGDETCTSCGKIKC